MGLMTPVPYSSLLFGDDLVKQLSDAKYSE
jgi:hypothetical protein